MRERRFNAAGCNGLEGYFQRKMSGNSLHEGKASAFCPHHNQNTCNITFPGGARENNEFSSEKTLARELLEETGLREMSIRREKYPLSMNLHTARGKQKKKEQR